MHPLRALSLACAGLAAAACSGSSSGDGRMTVRLVDAPADLAAVNLDVQRVEVNGPDGWRTLSSPNRIVNLLALTHGVADTLADATLPAGHYGQLRLLLGPASQVTLADGTVHDLKVPSGQQSGVKLVVSFDVAANTTKDVYIDFDAHRSIFVHEAGASEQFILRPTVRAFDKLETGAITGRLEDAATQAPLVGVEVMAEVVDGSGAPAIVRTVTTDADGRYVLDLLPVGGSYHVVAQPLAGGIVYGARASALIPVTATAPTPAWDAAFDVAANVGALSGAITPPQSSADSDVVSARATLDAGGAPALLVVRSVTATTTEGSESYAISSLPAGAYSLVVTRRTLNADLSVSERTSAAVPATVNAGVTATADLSL